jgi:23S rRNA (guanosine2251-2'-O)-methyltransferase
MKEWIYGRNPVLEAVRSGRRQIFRLQISEGVQEKGRIAEITDKVRSYKVPVERVPKEKLARLSENHQGIAAEVSPFPYQGVDDITLNAVRQNQPLFVLILDVIQNPQNLGSLLRTAEAVGVHGVIIPLARAVEVTPAVVSASAGASEHLIIAQANIAQSVADLKKAGVWVIGLEGAPEASTPEKVRLDGPLALVVGSEGEGMRELTRKSCDILLRLPMVGKIESLNAAVAGSIALYLAFQARSKSVVTP